MKGQTGKQFGDSGNDRFGIIVFVIRGKRKVQTVSCCQPGICNIGEQLVEIDWNESEEIWL